MKKRKVKKLEGKIEMIEDVLENPKSRFFVLVNDILALTTLVSILAIVLETVASLAVYLPIFKTIEYTATIIFTIEYGLRFWVAPKKIRYIFSFFGLLDLIAIVPTYLGLGNLSFLKASRSLRILRLLRMIRLAKFARVKRRKDGASSLYKLNIEIYTIALCIAVLGLGTLFYIFEGSAAHAADIPAGMFWAFKVVLGGIPFVQPTTTGGLITLIAAAFTSKLLLGLLIGLLGPMLRKGLIGSEKDS